MNNISVVIATFNEEKNIERCLKSIESLASEIIIVDADSSDKTRQLIKRFNPKIFSVRNDLMFHKNKQLGLEKANRRWILQLDADEVVSDELKQEIIKTLKQNNSNINGYYIPRRNYFLGRWMTKGGLYPDKVIRLIRRGKAFFPCKSVHEQIVVTGETGTLGNPLLHYSSPDLQTYLVKANRYTSLTARDLKIQGIKPSVINSIRYCFVLPFKTFISIFIINKGFMDGLHGFVWAFLSASHHFLAYAKLVIMKK